MKRSERKGVRVNEKSNKSEDDDKKGDDLSTTGGEGPCERFASLTQLVEAVAPIEVVSSGRGKLRPHLITGTNWALLVLLVARPIPPTEPTGQASQPQHTIAVTTTNTTTTTLRVLAAAGRTNPTPLPPHLQTTPCRLSLNYYGH
ncbi:hypothetical protein Pcinc_027072 [Petrolisthes cinctipes]|uniref:Uncharacterized protein n=1 Tax=Petrolisthes cinctipes TaxID=88211 RepID=A0AAE1K9C4_PETCI|nr:hypothetical protein Pcinc_027072 [Petrolisthes cinctipes]